MHSYHNVQYLKPSPGKGIPTNLRSLSPSLSSFMLLLLLEVPDPDSLCTVQSCLCWCLTSAWSYLHLGIAFCSRGWPLMRMKAHHGVQGGDALGVVSCDFSSPHLKSQNLSSLCIWSCLTCLLCASNACFSSGRPAACMSCVREVVRDGYKCRFIGLQGKSKQHGQVKQGKTGISNNQSKTEEHTRV